MLHDIKTTIARLSLRDLGELAAGAALLFALLVLFLLVTP